MVKAAGGGGGKGIRVVSDPADLVEALHAARREAEHAFGDARVFLERFIERGRHIEIQVLADPFGNTVHLFERECSAQRRHQKAIEESPSPLLALWPTLPKRVRGWARRVSRQQKPSATSTPGQSSLLPHRRAILFSLEMNTRLQVEHPVTELVTGLDLVKLQFAIASGEPLPFIRMI